MAARKRKSKNTTRKPRGAAAKRLRMAEPLRLSVPRDLAEVKLLLAQVHTMLGGLIAAANSAGANIPVPGEESVEAAPTPPAEPVTPMPVPAEPAPVPAPAPVPMALHDTAPAASA